MKKYDLIVIGAGSGGLNVAAFINRIGLKVLLIDKTDKNIGGDCLNTGCVPSKALLHVAELVQKSKMAKEFGCVSSGSVDMKKVTAYIKRQQDIIRVHEDAAWFRKQGMDVELGVASFIDEKTVKVGEKTFTAKRILLATGSRPRMPNLSELDKTHYLTNEEVFSLKELPRKLVIVGAGAIAIELAQAFTRLGSEVTVIVRGSRILSREDEYVALALQQQLEREGVRFLFNEEVKEYKKNSVVLSEKKVLFDKLLLAIGREKNLEGLGLEKAGIATDKHGLILNGLQTTNKRVFVAGDLAGPMFTHAAEVHAGALITSWLSFSKKPNFDNFAWVTYTDPELATFGRSEEELKKLRVVYERLELDHADDDRTICEGGFGRSILFLDKKGRILGGSVLAKGAGEIAQELILAMTQKIPVSKVMAKVYPYPTRSRVNKKIIGNYMGRKLSPLVMKIMRFLY